MRLSVLLKNIVDVSAEEDREITGLALDSRKVKGGDLFFAYPGTKFDGREFVEDAVKRGAIAIIKDMSPLPLGEGARRAGEGCANDPPSSGAARHLLPPAGEGKNTSIFPVANLSSYIGVIASRFYGNPSQHMQVVGVTGTNGKTSCCHFIAQALHFQNAVCGVIGTVGNGLYQSNHQHLQAADLTTPDAVSLQKQLAEWREQNVKYVAMEAASHGLVQGRVNGVQFAIAVFTNLSRDHLDYHGDMERYAQAKRLLFAQPGLQYAVLNVDDEYGKKWSEELNKKLNVFCYSLEKISAGGDIIYVHHAQYDATGFTASIHTPWGEGVLHNPFLIGRFNLSNLLASLTVLGILGLPLETILAALAQVRPVAGRMQTLGGEGKPLAVIDYSHTPDSLEKALQTLREHCKGKLWCVFGCGGDRDRGKRPLMGKIAEQYADCVVITDDNPRHEDPRAIVAEILQGLLDPAGAVIEHDRRRAIEHALSCAQADDIVLIAGKGHETYQIIGDEKNVFSDVLETQLILNDL